MHDLFRSSLSVLSGDGHWGKISAVPHCVAIPNAMSCAWLRAAQDRPDFVTRCRLVELHCEGCSLPGLSAPWSGGDSPTTQRGRHLTEVCTVHVAPDPPFTRLHGSDQRMAGLLMMPSGVASRRAVTTAKLTADETHPEVDGACFLGHTRRAGSGCGVGALDRGQVPALSPRERALEDDAPQRLGQRSIRHGALGDSASVIRRPQHPAGSRRPVN